MKIYNKAIAVISILLVVAGSELNILYADKNQNSFQQQKAKLYAAANTNITYKQAENLIKNYLLSKKLISANDKKLVVQYDHMDKAGGKSYYVIHVYDNMTDHTATLGWYGIDIQGDSVYDFLFLKEIARLKTKTTSTANKKNNAVPKKITASQAEKLIKDFLLQKKLINNADKKLVVQYDHMDKAEGKSYYVIHVYDNMTDHTATLGWYGIDIYGSSIYDFLLLKKLR